jgi:transcriptional regulator with XRE-family HTH domain
MRRGKPRTRGQEFIKRDPNLEFRLQELVDAKGLSMAQFARDIKVAPTTVNDWVSGHVDLPKSSDIVLICRKLNVRLDELMDLSSKINPKIS